MAVHLLFQIVSGFLMVEMVLVLLLLVPFVKATTWKRLYESALWLHIRDSVNKTLRTELKYKYFLIAVIAIVTISFLDSARDVYKVYFPDQDKEDIDKAINPCAHHIQDEKYYRESKVFLITGFTLYLSIVLYLLRSTIAKRATLESELEVALQSQSGKKIQTSSDDIETLRKSNVEVTVELKETKEALLKAQTDLADMKEKYQNMNTEYDALLEKYDMQEKKEVVEESKKDL